MVAFSCRIVCVCVAHGMRLIMTHPSRRHCLVVHEEWTRVRMCMGRMHSAKLFFQVHSKGKEESVCVIVNPSSLFLPVITPSSLPLIYIYIYINAPGSRADRIATLTLNVRNARTAVNHSTHLPLLRLPFALTLLRCSFSTPSHLLELRLPPASAHNTAREDTSAHTHSQR